MPISICIAHESKYHKVASSNTLGSTFRLLMNEFLILMGAIGPKTRFIRVFIVLRIYNFGTIVRRTSLLT